MGNFLQLLCGQGAQHDLAPPRLPKVRHQTSGLKPGLVEIGLPRRMHPATLHGRSRVAKQLAPEWLDDDARILEDLFGLADKLAPRRVIGDG